MTEIPERAKLARQMYEEGAPTRDILLATGLNHFGLYHWVDGGPKRGGARPLPPLPRRKIITRSRILKSERVALVNRMMRASEKQVSDIEERLARAGAAPAERERDARTMAVLVKTLRELTALDAMHREGAPKPETTDDNDHSFPRDVGELRRVLAEKIDRLAAEAAAEGSDRT